ncbi:hypothetical protein [Teichococcus rhizosphaerae]|uniref:hypothetical protein n=1 Tax=Teichococcus rhizosphaerae TaxID=1335062 RepID=UPI00114584B8|nr:hypothetical protein [Pseudoroseomonas rhizosphaerae]
MTTQTTPRSTPAPAPAAPSPVLGGSSEASRQARLREVYRPGTRLPQEPARRGPSWFDRP